ncbi:MAG: GNAT family N-acetyltransferase [Armatimonadetes bacterium]|nr:GNAT family N-acetyltransferase [Armatimonadota bacterium]
MNKKHWLHLLNEDRKRTPDSATTGDGWIRVDYLDESSVIWSELTEETADSAIQAQVEFVRSCRRSFEWKLYDYDSPADLGTRLRAAGFREEPSETVLVISVSEALKWTVAADFEVRVCASEDDVEAYKQVAETVFAKNYQPTCDELLCEIRKGRNSNVGFVCYQDSTPVGCGRLYPNPGCHFAGLYGGGTLPSHRGRGVYHSLLAARARYAYQAGCKNLLIDALPTSKPIVERLGFRAIAITTPYKLLPEI